VAELCQFLGGSWKVINNIQQLSQHLCTVINRGSGLILSKNTSQLKWKGPKKGKQSGFLKNRKVFDCEPTSATRELKKEVNVRI
jgi:hypothetical protein